MSEEKNNPAQQATGQQVPLIYELSRPGRRAFRLPPLDVPATEIGRYIPEKFLRRSQPRLPEVDKLQIVRHYTNLSKRNVGVDDTFYPLGSCTMKYNPKINEHIAAFPGFTQLHPYQPEATVQGILQIFYQMQEYLRDICGLAQVSLAPAAGAHGELSSLMVIKAYHRAQNRDPKIVLIPDSAHGTNPASSALCGYQVKTIKSCQRGFLAIEDLDANLNENVAALMITNPNTLGLFEEHILEITRKVHEVGALVYMDGANMNALLGIAKPGDFGIDVMHYNLHKTFSTPHGGGGPGSGPIAVTEKLADFLPGPITVKKEDGSYGWSYMPGNIGKTRGFFGNTGIIVRAYAYIRALGKEGLARVAPMAVLNANYLLQALKKHYDVPYDHTCMHECVLSANLQKQQHGVRALDIAKRLLDLKFHPPTIYFPLIVPEAMMIEPTETENREALDAFIAAMQQIASEAQEEPWKLQEAPFLTPVTRLDEVKAAREPLLRWQPKEPERNN